MISERELMLMAFEIRNCDFQRSIQSPNTPFLAPLSKARDQSKKTGIQV
jgi:hypothetical protein